MEPMFRLASSGLKTDAGSMRSSTVMCGDPPVVMLMTALVLALSLARIGSKWAGSWDGRPSLGSRACMWTMAAPASAAPMAASAISSALTGRWGDIDGVWMAPVTAEVMMTLRLRDMMMLLSGRNVLFRQAPG
jgi:hypothetical protein